MTLRSLGTMVCIAALVAACGDDNSGTGGNTTTPPAGGNGGAGGVAGGNGGVGGLGGGNTIAYSFAITGFDNQPVDGAGVAVDLSDAIGSLEYLFLGAPNSCPDALDANDDGAVDIADPIGILLFLYAGGQPPAAPYPETGEDPTGDELGCSAR